ncbi:MAG TPA: hypothetical protein VK589_08490 [Chryseolinea sp.]|nr:hypothetical protein [Chryseolinea sp.]
MTNIDNISEHKDANKNRIDRNNSTLKTLDAYPESYSNFKYIFVIINKLTQRTYGMRNFKSSFLKLPNVFRLFSGHLYSVCGIWWKYAAGRAGFPDVFPADPRRSFPRESAGIQSAGSAGNNAGVDCIYEGGDGLTVFAECITIE